MAKNENKIKTTAFLSVFEQKLNKLIKNIKKEYTKPKAERNKSSLKAMAQEAKGLKKLIKDCRDKEGIRCICCPNCGHEIEV